MKLTEKGKELLLRVKDRILEEPARIRMYEWYNGPSRMDYLDRYTLHAAIPPCNTVACIAGWMLIEGGKIDQLEANPWADTILQDALDLIYEDGTGPRSARLFLPDSWPADLTDKTYDMCTGTPEYAAVVAEAIDRFIEDPEAF